VAHAPQGHSLGASYATLFHTALLSVQAGSGTFTKPSGSDPAQPQSGAAPAPLAALVTLRDLWTFGCPRLGLADFAQLQHDLMAAHDGASWRLVDAKDPVALVPPDPLHLGKAGDAFVHVDAGVRMSADAPPVPIPSELEGVEKTGVSALLHFPNHCECRYRVSGCVVERPCSHHELLFGRACHCDEGFAGGGRSELSPLGCMFCNDMKTLGLHKCDALGLRHSLRV
jgi:hypothetical protein